MYTDTPQTHTHGRTQTQRETHRHTQTRMGSVPQGLVMPVVMTATAVSTTPPTPTAWQVTSTLAGAQKHTPTPKRHPNRLHGRLGQNPNLNLTFKNGVKPSKPPCRIEVGYQHLMPKHHRNPGRLHKMHLENLLREVDSHLPAPQIKFW